MVKSGDVVVIMRPRQEYFAVILQKLSWVSKKIFCNIFTLVGKWIQKEQRRWRKSTFIRGRQEETWRNDSLWVLFYEFIEIIQMRPIFWRATIERIRLPNISKNRFNKAPNTLMVTKKPMKMSPISINCPTICAVSVPIPKTWTKLRAKSVSTFGSKFLMKGIGMMQVSSQARTVRCMKVMNMRR